MKKEVFLAALLLFFISCKENKNKVAKEAGPTTELLQKGELKSPFFWNAANIYFLLTDRFNNGDTLNDINLNRTKETAVLRGFMGGDIQGITQKINDGYFTDLGINAIWFSPIVEQIHGTVDEGTGSTYGYHGYWAKDWTALDPNFGTKKELEILVKTAHKNGIRILMDIVLNHTGPVTDMDPVWPKEWVRTEPVCEFTDYESTTTCTLVKNLPDIITESDTAVELPDALLAKWKEEGRLSNELDELQVFFDRTKYPRAPRFYIIKWLTDYVNDLGIDGFRVDTAKHVDEKTWQELYSEASYAFNTWKRKHPEEVLDNNPFFMVGEVYGYGISSGREYDFGDKKVDYFGNGFQSLINFELKDDANRGYEAIFSKYSDLLFTELEGKSVVNYLASHDDNNPFDKERKNPFHAANVLLLTPGASQIYYGDESIRSLTIEGAQGDATLRSFMNWRELDSIPLNKKILGYWQKLGKFRNDHPAIGAGRHQRLSKSPYVFGRTFINGEFKDKVVVGLKLPKGKKSLWVKGFFGDGTKLHDAFSKTMVTVENGKVFLDNDFEIALLELAKN
ncbi:alpha-amylase family glycosyl hydrolase [Arenibacter sp. S6351L]|uniref:alpha-amylase family glycosyl hydrolase n=1 Tax=Arenibacter sp. S6351L TaxID=2926407 RepID=UPI001FF1902B|nr:alpha-amylase family glycosyl hydrolase [Arenibacter sp. S6351L]MCK0134694.1 alpha-amylase family glycosyl hydrolase [Arenibacter sp. S6351L]